MFHQVTPPNESSNIWAIKNIVSNGWVMRCLHLPRHNCSVRRWLRTDKWKLHRGEHHTQSNGNRKDHAPLLRVKTRRSHSEPVADDTFDGFFNNARPTPPALSRADPASISNVSMTPGSDFKFNVDITNASGVYGLEFSLSFNATLLNANSITRGSFIPLSATVTTQIDNATGFVKFNVSSSSSLDGNGVLAQISFHVQNLGTTVLHLYSIQLIDSLGSSLAFTSSDGAFDNILVAKLAIDPPVLIDPTLVPPATFKVNVTLAEVRDLYGYQFNLSFDPNVLVCLQVEVQDVMNETHYIPNQMIDNTQGFVFINVTYYSPAVPINIDAATTLVTIKFRVKSLGATNLTLTDTQLVDSGGQPITHEVHNGFFQSLIIDVGIVDISASPDVLYQGGDTNVSITVTNEGNITENFPVYVYYNSTLLTTLNVTGLAPNTNATITFVWYTTGVPYGKYVLSAQIPPLPFETHVSDNTLTGGIVKLKIQGDINGDDVVDIYDALLAAGAYGSKPGDPNWNPNADLNGDGVVDIYDIIILAGHFGQRI